VIFSSAWIDAEDLSLRLDFVCQIVAIIENVT
jgi:hypothetical protein